MNQAELDMDHVEMARAIEVMQKNCSECGLRIAEQSGATRIMWETQQRFNMQVESFHAQIDKRLSAVEKKILWLSGFAAGFGAFLGSMVTYFMKGG